MTGKIRAGFRKAWTTLRKILAKFWKVFFGLCFIAYFSVWGIWVVGGLRLLGELGATIPFLGDAYGPSAVGVAFVVASVVVLLIGGIGFERDLKAFLRWQPRKD